MENLSDLLFETAATIREDHRARYAPISEEIDLLLAVMAAVQMMPGLDAPPASPNTFRRDVRNALRIYEQRTVDPDDPMRTLPPRRVSIVCIDHPEWGTWGVSDDCGGYYNIYNERGGRILDKDEAVRFWRLADKGDYAR